MKIRKILNNNVVIVADQDGKEKNIIENGLGFKRKVGDNIDSTESQQVFVLSDDLYQKYIKLTDNIDPLAVEIAENIIQYASEQLGTDLNEMIHLTMTDHIAGVMSRLKSGLSLTNQLTVEISRIYSKEFQLGQYACHLLEEKLGQVISNDEAAFIAMHFINAQLDKEEEVQTTLRFVSDIVKVVETYFGQEYDVNSFSYYRFVMHLRGLVNRIYADKPFHTDDQLYQTFSTAYPGPANCVDKVVKMIYLKYGKDVSSEEKAYLTLYVEKLNREREEF